MDATLRDFKWQICMCYLAFVLDCLHEAGLVPNSKKCRFGERQALMFGHLVDREGLWPDPQKTGAIAAFPEPRNVKEFHRFLGLCSYFRRFVPRFADVAHPLMCLLQKDAPYEWAPECDSSFRQLKFLLTSHPILEHFNPSAPTEVHTEASGVGIGAVLVQRSY